MRSEYSVRAVSLLIFLPLLFRPAALTAQSAQGSVVPLKNWAAPLYWQPNQAEMAEREAVGGVTPKLQFSASQVSSSALTFVAVTPCRLVDTRGAAAGFNGLSPFAGPSLAPSSTVTFPVQSAAEATADTTPTPCGTIPSIAQAYSFNVTVIPKTAGGIAFVTVWPSGGAQPAVSTINDGQGLILANAAIVPAGTPSGGVNVVSSGPATMDLIIDMNGFYAAPSDLNGNTAVGSGALVSNAPGVDNTAVGVDALQQNAGTYNTATGGSALFSNTTGSENTASGFGALLSNTTGSNNTASGFFALQGNTTGCCNTASGDSALQSNTVGSSNTASGYEALKANAAGTGNTATGASALLNNTTGNYNTATSTYALGANTTGGNNTASGYAALSSNTTGGDDTALGVGALYSNTTGSNNIAIGYEAGSSVSAGNSNNIHVGSLGAPSDGAGVNGGVIRIGTIGTQTSFFAAGVTSANLGSDSNAVPVVVDTTTGQLGVGNSSAGGGIAGVTAGTDLTGGGTSGAVTLNLDTTKVPTLAGANTFTGTNSFTGNINMGASLLYQGSPVLQVQVPTTLSNSNIAVGIGALQNNTTGTNNTAGGYSALAQNSSGSYNTASGWDALLFNTTGSENTGVGVQALANYSTTSGNSAVGYQALQGGPVASANTGGNNAAIGSQTLENNTTGSNNTASGYQALNSNTAGYNNTAIGELALFYNTTGCCNIAIGPNAGNLVSGGNSGNIHIGSQGASGDSGAIRIGDTQTMFFAAGIYGVSPSPSGVPVMINSSGQLGAPSSSRRYKEDIQDMSDASRGLMDLRPVTFRYKKAAEDGSKPLQYGLIAEEVAEVYPDLVVYKGGQPDAVQYQMLPPMLLNEVQKQNQHARQQDETIRRQQEQVVQQQEQVLKQQEQIRSLEARLAALEGLLSGKVRAAATAGQ
jgi:trimeric autotransporter adhesin